MKGPLFEVQFALVQALLEFPLLIDAPSYLTVARLGCAAHRVCSNPTAPPNRVVCVSDSYRGIECTPETAEPLGVSPPEAVDLFQIK